MNFDDFFFVEKNINLWIETYKYIIINTILINYFLLLL